VYLYEYFSFYFSNNSRYKNAPRQPTARVGLANDLLLGLVSEGERKTPGFHRAAGIAVPKKTQIIKWRLSVHQAAILKFIDFIQNRAKCKGGISGFKTKQPPKSG
jgi:hypothetical protein